MAFSFGGGNNNGPAPAPGPAGGGFSFGTPAPTAAPTFGGAPAPSTGGFSFGGTPAPTPGGFSFGGTSAPAPSAPVPAPGANPTTPAPAPSTTTSFSFGGTPAPANAPASGAPTPAPATPGFSFGGTPAPAPAATTPAPAPGFSFGNTPAPATSGFSSGGDGAPPPPGGLSSSASTFGSALTTTASTTPAPAGTPAPPPADQATLNAPEYDAVFRNLKLWTEIQRHCNQETVMAGQELMHCVRTNINDLKPKILEWTFPNQSLRQQLVAKPVVSLKGGTTTLTKKVLERIVDLSTDLHISETEATTLYAQVMGDLEVIQSIPMTNIVEQGMGAAKKYTVITKLAREFYFYERHLRLQTLLYMIQARMREKQNTPIIVEATDLLLEAGLVSDLIKLIKEYTHRIQQLHTEIAASKPQIPAYGNPALLPPSQQPPRPNFRKVHLLFANQERQAACECLFLIAYNIQLLPSEMANLLDLIRDLSTLVPPTSPFTNVPSPYEAASTPTAIPNTTPWPSASSTPPPFSYALKEKDPLVWQREMVSNTFESGAPQTMQCICLLVITAIAAMESRQVLFDRKLHGPNAFGSGNAFLPPDDMSFDGIKELHSRLSPNALSQWARKDIWGVLAAAYALLLRSSPALLSSPRMGSSSQFSLDIRHAARECSELPVDLKSFTFSRLTLIPIIQRLPPPPETFADVSEFGLSVFSDFYSLYLNVLAEGRLPVSRRRWEKEEDEELKLKREQQARQRQYREWAGSSSTSTEMAIPASVDLTARPDCLDDIIALATTICSLGKIYSRKFWSINTDDEILPSRILLDLERSQKKDDSLLPSYISLLAALSNDEESANAVHALLSRAPDVANDAATMPPLINWTTIIFNLRWYAQELSPYDGDAVSKPTSTSTTTTTRNTDYYYNLDGQNVPLMATTTTTTIRQGEASSSSPASSKAKELSTLASFRVASHLAVIMNVALFSPAAQHAILSTSIPIGDGASTGSDEALLVLFKLAISPLSPQMRGATLAAIASLLRPPTLGDKEKDAFVLEQARHGWEYLESCPLLPIALMDQYRVVNGNASDARVNIGLAFPPSSISLANSATLESVLPKDQNYGLIYAMEHVEARMGWYPSIEGFLQMLKSLICTAGCPSKLGQNWRVRSGCAPYVEFVVDFVLPRALGLKGSPKLPFRVNGDQSRLVSHALSVVEAVIVRYNIPCTALNVKKGPSASSLLGIQSVVDDVVVSGEITNNQEAADDFKNLSVSSYITPDNSDLSLNAAPPGSSGADLKIPSAKSPGFIVLADILSSVGGVIFQAIGTILTELGGAEGIAGFFGLQSDRMDMAYALFGATPPDINSAKEGVKDNDHSRHLQSLLKPLVPCTHSSILDPNMLDDAIYWREGSIVLALRILCAAAVREESFITAVDAAKGTIKIIPVLRFQNIRFGSANLRCSDVLLARLPRLLFSFEGSSFIRKSLVQYIGHSASTGSHDSALSATALSLFYFLHQSMPSNHTLKELCGNDSENFLAKAIATRVVASSKWSYSTCDTQATNFVLNWILSDLRAGRVSNDGLVQLLLGLPSDTYEGSWKPGSRQYAGSIIDCFDSILEILKHTDDENSSVAALCFEILFRLYDLLKNESMLSLRIALYTAERLRAVQFWRSKTLLWLSARGTSPLLRASSDRLVDVNPDILHCVSWLLKGLACELQLLVGFTNCRTVEDGSVMSGLLAPRPFECTDLLSLLFGANEAIVHRLLNIVPLEKVFIDSNLIHPPVNALRTAVHNLAGPLDVVSGYQQLDSNKVLASITSKHSPEELASMRAWSDEYNSMSAWNCSVAHLCQAIFVIIDASLGSSESLKLSGASILGLENAGLQANGLASLLTLLLQRISDDSSEATHHGMDSRLLPAATCNLGNAALVLAESITGLKEHEALSTGELLVIAAGLSVALAHSAIGEESTDEAPTRYERTTVLGSTLTLLLSHTLAAEPDLVRQYRNLFIKAIRSLEKLACYKVDSKCSESQAIVSVLARTIIGGIITSCCDESDTQEHSFVCHAISNSFVRSLIELLGDLDEHVCSLLQIIALQPFGARILMDSGLCHALRGAARKYLVEEDRVAAKLRDGGGAYSKTIIQTPSFLLSHLKLISAVMASDTLPQKRASDAALEVLETFALYKHIVQRLCFNFPNEADVLRWFLRCFVQAASLARPANSAEIYDRLSANGSKAKRIFSEARFLENGIAMLCQQLWENPLPKELLPDTPYSLKASERQPQSQVVSVKHSKSQTWWDVLEQELSMSSIPARYDFSAPVARNDFGYWNGRKFKNWSDNKFEYNIIALDVLSLGLSLLKRLNRFDLIDGLSVAHGLFNCSCTAESVENRIEEVRFRTDNTGSLMDTEDRTSSVNDELEVEYLTLLGTTMARCVEELLVISYELAVEAKENGNIRVASALKEAIVMSGIDSKGVGCLSLTKDAENRKKLADSLCSRIKEQRKS